MAHIIFESAQSGRFAHFNDSERAFPEPGITRLDRISERAMRATPDPLATARTANHLRRPLSAVGDRRGLDLGVGHGIAKPKRDVFRTCEALSEPLNLSGA